MKPCWRDRAGKNTYLFGKAFSLAQNSFAVECTVDEILAILWFLAGFAAAVWLQICQAGRVGAKAAGVVFIKDLKPNSTINKS